VLLWDRVGSSEIKLRLFSGSGGKKRGVTKEKKFFGGVLGRVGKCGWGGAGLAGLDQ